MRFGGVAKLWRRCAVGCLAGALAVTSLAMPLGGQDEPQGDAAAFGGAQMVRGTVTAVSADKLTLKTEEGQSYLVLITPNTRLTRSRQTVKLADIKVGDGAGAMGVLDAPTKTVHAVFVGVVDAEDLRRAREGLGKVYITGRVVAIDDLKISVKRPDDVVQVIEVDEGTSFQRGGRGMMSEMTGMGPGTATQAGRAETRGESITLADVKVGDMVGGPGSLKAGVFVPAVLHVSDPAMARRRRNGAAGSNGPSGTTQPM